MEQSQPDWAGVEGYTFDLDGAAWDTVLQLVKFEKDYSESARAYDEVETKKGARLVKC